MHAIEIAADARLLRLLPDAGFADAYRILCPAPPPSARLVCRDVFDRPPRWVDALMAARNGLVGLFGLKPGVRGAAANAVGIFPVLSESAQELLLGFDDHHLDFRIAVTVLPAEGAQQVTVTTLVRTHNRLGRIYLAAILPFHRLIARALLNRAARSWQGRPAA